MRLLSFLFLGIVCLTAFAPGAAFATGPATIDFDPHINPNLPGANPASSGISGLVSNFYSTALVIAGILAFGAIVWGGIKYAAGRGNPAAESEGKSWITNALLGLLLLAGAYIILYTINPNIVSLYIPGLPQLPPPAAGGGGGGGGGGGRGGGLSDAAARAQLAAAGITVNHPCPQTCLNGMRQQTIDELIRLRQACGCNIQVTAGTEGDNHGEGTCSHGNGYKADIGLGNPDSYIQNNCTNIGPRSGDHAQQYRCTSGAVYARESNHWDMKIGC